MGMVYCRGCGKEIHETAPTCPHCGAPQGMPSNINSSRNKGVLVVVALGWTLIMWLAFLVLGGFLIGLLGEENIGVTGKQFGEAVGGPLLIISGIISALLTKLGKLPGTKKS